MRRNSELIRKLVLLLEDYPSNLGDVFILDGAQPELAIDGYSSDEITYHLEQLKEMGLIDSPGSQPMTGVTFAGLSPQGHDMAEQVRNQTDAVISRVQPSPTTVAVGGRPPADWWEDLLIDVCFQHFRGDLKPKTQADIERAMQEWITARGFEAASSTVRTRARKIWQAIKREDED